MLSIMGLEMKRLLFLFIGLLHVTIMPFPFGLEDANANDDSAQAATKISAKKAEKVRIMTYNIRRKGSEPDPKYAWENRLPLVVGLIKKITPTILGLQEVTKEQFDDLKAELKKYESFGQGRGSSWFGWGTDEHTPIFYNKKRVELLEQGTFPLNQDDGYWAPWKRQSTGLLPRIATWARFKDLQSDKEFYVYNTHLDNMYDEARLNQQNVICQQIIDKTRLEQQTPIIVMGDFNAEFHSMTGFAKANSNCASVLGPQDTRTGWEDGALKEIDHILLSVAHLSSWEVQKYVVAQKGKEEPYASDHRPVYMDIKFHSAEQAADSLFD